MHIDNANHAKELPPAKPRTLRPVLSQSANNLGPHNWAIMYRLNYNTRRLFRRWTNLQVAYSRMGSDQVSQASTYVRGEFIRMFFFCVNTSKSSSSLIVLALVCEATYIRGLLLRFV